MDRRNLLKLGALAALQLYANVSSAHDESNPARVMLRGRDVSGGLLSLDDFAGKTMLISFFASGCALCARDLKLMREFYVSNVKRNFVLLGVNMDADKMDFDAYNRLIMEAIPKEQRFPMIWHNGSDYRDNFGVINRSPTHFIVSAERQVVLKREGSFQPDDWDNLWSSLT